MWQIRNWFRATGVLMLAAAVCGAAITGYGFVRWQMAAELYQQRLAELGSRYEQLQSTYNDAVRKTAVTELRVDEAGRVSLRIRSAAGTLRELDTPFTASQELYVDYVVQNGRLWIRRLFDAGTAPRDGLLIDPELGDIDWDAPGVRHGKAVYRALAPGRWVISVTGDGSLGLTRVAGEPDPDLAPPPEVREYPPIEEQARQEASEIGVAEVLRYLLGF
ncbi:MAG: hypothetical protein ACLFVN_04750 [Phycisphaeraceae bacterium]